MHPTTLLPRVLGHRGAAGHAPENTLTGLRTAASLGCRWVEVDVRPASDGRPVLHHDATLERTTGHADIVEHTPFEVLAQRRVRLPHDIPSDTIPSLEAALALAARLGLGVNLEIKSAAGRARPVGPAVVDLLRHAWAAHLPPPLISSFDADELRAVRHAGSDALLAYLSEEPDPAFWTAVDELAVRVIGLADACATPDLLSWVARTRPRLSVLVFTVNERERASELLRQGVHGVFSDFPDRLGLARAG